MSVEQHHERVPLRRAAPHTYFVGRRIFEATEVYAVTASDIERAVAAHSPRSVLIVHRRDDRKR